MRNYTTGVPPDVPYNSQYAMNLNQVPGTFNGAQPYLQGGTIPPRNPYVNSTMPYRSSYGLGMNMSNPYFSDTNMGYPGIWQSGMLQGVTAESSAAFQSVETIVRSLSSVTAMIENTFHAVYSSFHSVLAVTHQFSELKTRFAQIFSAFTIIRGMKRLVYKLLGLLGIAPDSLAADDVWREVNTTPAISPGQSSYKMYTYLFFALIYIGPLILWKIHSLFQNENDRDWRNSNNPQNTTARCTFNYDAKNYDEMNVKVGQTLTVAPNHMQTDRNWILVSNGIDSGLIPRSNLTIKDTRQ